MRRRCVRFLLCLSLALPPVCLAQTIQGRLVQDSDGQPVPGAFVVLLDASGRAPASAMTDSDGSFTLVAPRPGSYRLRSAVIGWHATLSPSVALERGSVLQYTFAIRPQPVRLDAIVVTQERQCAARADAGAAVVAVWEEARKALDAVSWTRTSARLGFRWIQYERMLDASARRVLEETSSDKQGLFASGPFKTLDPETLWSTGFVRQLDSGEWVFEGPDAAVFLSDQFAELHCFEIAQHEIDSRLIGLAFRPIEGRDVPEIAGTLWLDRLSGELRFLEFRFVQLPWRARNDNKGGRIEFQRLPSGAWTVRRWWIRIPWDVGGPSFGPIKEVGALVTEIRGRDGRPIVLDALATVTGVAYDSTRMMPLSRTQLSLRGTSYRTRADDQGHFAIHDVPPGRYWLTLDHPDLAVLPPIMRSLETALLPADTLQVWIGVPSVETLWQAYCPGVTLTNRVSLISGVVTLAGSGEPAAGATVAARSRRWRILARQPYYDVEGGDVVSVVAGRDGRYALCGVEPDLPITLRAALGASESDDVVAWGKHGGITRMDLVLRPER
ncbi:MAG: carboxypeptidase regulatory-like domain-containing protein [Gemmatimonadota bacterium]|nr:MAG: carboxypeptidase regulatory-like domain-containing protein [Gemmatimonadota bacterium]